MIADAVGSDDQPRPPTKPPPSACCSQGAISKLLRAATHGTAGSAPRAGRCATVLGRAPRAVAALAAQYPALPCVRHPHREDRRRRRGYVRLRGGPEGRTRRRGGGCGYIWNFETGQPMGQGERGHGGRAPGQRAAGAFSLILLCGTGSGTVIGNATYRYRSDVPPALVGVGQIEGLDAGCAESAADVGAEVSEPA